MIPSLIVIESFDPLRLQLPAAVDLAGHVMVQLPPVHVKLVDLSLGGLIEDKPHLGADLPMTCIRIDLPKPGTVGEIVNMLISTAGAWQSMWRASQKALDRCGPILG